jgi:hypothetical protein
MPKPGPETYHLAAINVRPNLKESLHRGVTKRPAALTWPRFVVPPHPAIEIGLAVVD